MSKLFLALLISIFSVTTFPAYAANKHRSDSKKSQITATQKQPKQSDNSFRDKPLSSGNIQSEVNEPLRVSPVDSSPPKPTEVNYEPPANFSDRNPISN